MVKIAVLTVRDYEQGSAKPKLWILWSSIKHFRDGILSQMSAISQIFYFLISSSSQDMITPTSIIFNELN